MLAHPMYIIKGAEVPIDYMYGDKGFTGSIDRLIYDTATNTYLIQDIKSWQIMEGKHDDDRKLPVQLAVYSLALSEMENCALVNIRPKLQYVSCSLGKAIITWRVFVLAKSLFQWQQERHSFKLDSTII